MSILARKVTVCGKCLQASCWAGEFMCEESREAGTTEMSIEKLRLLQYENPEWWFKDASTGDVNQADLSAYYQEVTSVSEG
jgi:hypothetical protein